MRSILRVTLLVVAILLAWNWLQRLSPREPAERLGTMYERGDMVRITRLSGRGPLPDVRILAVAGDRVHLSDAGLFVNDLSAGGIPANVWRTLSRERFERTVPDGYVMVVSTRTRHWGLLPEESVERHP